MRSLDVLLSQHLTFRADICRVTRRAKPASTGVAGDGTAGLAGAEAVASGVGGGMPAASRSTARVDAALPSLVIGVTAADGSAAAVGALEV